MPILQELQMFTISDIFMLYNMKSPQKVFVWLKFLIWIQNIYLQKFSAAQTTAFISSWPSTKRYSKKCNLHKKLALILKAILGIIRLCTAILVKCHTPCKENMTLTIYTGSLNLGRISLIQHYLHCGKLLPCSDIQKVV